MAKKKKVKKKKPIYNTKIFYFVVVKEGSGEILSLTNRSDNSQPVVKRGYSVLGVKKNTYNKVKISPSSFKFDFGTKCFVQVSKIKNQHVLVEFTPKGEKYNTKTNTVVE